MTTRNKFYAWKAVSINPKNFDEEGGGCIEVEMIASFARPAQALDGNIVKICVRLPRDDSKSIIEIIDQAKKSGLATLKAAPEQIESQDGKFLKDSEGAA